MKRTLSLLPLLLLGACEARREKEPTITYEPTCQDAEEVVITSTPTWSSGVGQLVADSCGTCHVAGGIAPFALSSYAEAAPLAGAMASAVAERRMPPWLPSSCGDCRTWEHDRSLTDEEIATIRAWADAGAPEGDGGTFAPEALPALDRVDATVDPGVDYTPPAAPDDTYRCFLVDPPSATSTHVTGYEVVPGNPEVAHHVILYRPVDAAAEADAEALDAVDAEAGWECFGGAGVNAAPLALWAPGAGATEFPDGTGLPLTGERLILQVHYNVANGTAPDRTTVDLRLEETVDAPATFQRVQVPDIALAPGEEALQVEHAVQLEGEGSFRVWGVIPHMHELGTSLSVRATSGGGETCLVDVPRWDFHWQGVFFYEEPVTLDRDSTVTLTCVYDTTSRSEVTYGGENTEDEMCLSFAYVSR